MPFENYKHVEKFARNYGISPDVAKFSYIDANDPWIEYWLARYLHDKGVSSWASLTRDNPVTKLFWYPWGRDFTHTEFPFIPVVGALTPGGMRVVEWVSLLPPVFGTLAIIIAAIYMYRVYGRPAAIIAAALLSLLPASTSRTYAGFVEKIGIALPFLILGLMFYAEALRRRSLVYAVAAGAAFGVISYVWGGYVIAGLAIAVTSLLVPLAVNRLDEAKPYLLTSITVAATALAASIPADIYGPASIRFYAAALAVALYVYGIVFVLEKLHARSTVARGFVYRLAARWRKFYTYVLAASIIIGMFIASLIKLPSRAVFAIAWPLRETGLIHLSLLAETVAEHSSPLTDPRLMRDFMWSTNVLVVLAPIAGLYLLYRGLWRREAYHIPLAITALGLYYAVLGMVYFQQAASVVGILATAALTPYVLEPITITSIQRTRRWRRKSQGPSELQLLGAVVFIALIAGGMVVSAYRTVNVLEKHVAMITGYSLDTTQLGWLYLLDYLRQSISNDTVVVTWWDYGYQISVGAERPSVADGATINATQIRLLAEFYTATSEDEAASILERLGLKPNQTLIFVHDLALYNPSKGILVYTPAIDIPKSAAMLHIAEKDKEGFWPINDKYMYTMIYRFFSTAPFYLDKIGIAVPNVTELVKPKTVLVGNLQMKPFTMKRFEPYMVVVGFYIDAETGQPIAKIVNGDVYYYVMLLILFKWVK
ncbi:STT3 domain-containing protein [Hyperthermus butylicus]|uniref:dolichyl-phosphooligosaccharide-protein glycotransferase n=1 Tax=Hyperthermus butylicus (strain DSM 5456 / JCM 9403 / PLM1-5) TaxID=415426 RepID=A2BM28_HYPBU|nr:STT3 domain-containing protein [Hyperthermus butylicus]ABM81039.1 universally conserved protein [Hyperthermus butylicus DSM 5456]